MTEQYTRGGYTISTDGSRMDATTIHRYLSASYWAEGRSRATVEKSIRHSLCFGVFEGETQIGFARVITDHTIYAYLCDIFILESHQGRGLGNWLLECIMAHKELRGLGRWSLVTRDAHGFYARFGFQPLADPGRYMEFAAPKS